MPLATVAQSCAGTEVRLWMGAGWGVSFALLGAALNEPHAKAFVWG